MARETIPDGLAFKAPSFDENTPLTKILSAVLENSAVIVTRDGEYSGVVDLYAVYRHLQDFRLDKKDTAAKLAVRVPTITSNTEIADAVYYFYKNRTRALPYSKNDKVIGLLTRPTLIKVMLSEGMLSGLLVKDAMSYPLVGTESTSTVTQARAVMRQHKIDRLAVFENKNFVGVLTSYDMIDKIARVSERLPEMKGDSSSKIVVSSIALSNPFTIDAARPLSDAARVLIEKNISSIIATQQDRPAGILTELDIITSVMAAQDESANKIFISGLDASTYIYEDEIRESLKNFLKKTEKLKNVKVGYISLVVRKFKTNSYDIHARISFGKRANFSVFKSGHIFERTLSEVLDTLEKEVKRVKEKGLSTRREMGAAGGGEE